jgi:cytochrome c oxidase assembly protein subunit 15
LVKNTFLSRLALYASFFALGVIALGAFTRLIDAGLGCPDWPGCYGHLTVPTTAGAEYPGAHVVAHKAWAEMVHRYFVSGLSIFILAIVGTIFTKRNYRTLGNIVLALMLILLLCYQIELGRWTVTLKLLPVIVSQHLLGGFLILSMLWLVYLNNRTQNFTVRTRKIPNVKPLLLFAIIALLLVFGQIMLGAWTSTNYASLSCPGFPFCVKDQALTMHFQQAFNLFSPVGVNYEGGVLPEAIRQTIQMAHRFGAMLVTVYLLLLMIISVPKLKSIPELMMSLYLILLLLCLQLCFGISNVIFKLPLATAISHNIAAALLLLSVITFTYKLADFSKRFAA